MGSMAIENGVQMIAWTNMFTSCRTKHNINGSSDMYALVDKSELGVHVFWLQLEATIMKIADTKN